MFDDGIDNVLREKEEEENHKCAIWASANQYP